MPRRKKENRIKSRKSRRNPNPSARKAVDLTRLHRCYPPPAPRHTGKKPCCGGSPEYDRHRSSLSRGLRRDHKIPQGWRTRAKACARTGEGPRGGALLRRADPTAAGQEPEKKKEDMMKKRSPQSCAQNREEGGKKKWSRVLEEAAGWSGFLTPPRITPDRQINPTAQDRPPTNVGTP